MRVFRVWGLGFRPFFRLSTHTSSSRPSVAVVGRSFRERERERERASERKERQRERERERRGEIMKARPSAMICYVYIYTAYFEYIST